MTSILYTKLFDENLDTSALSPNTVQSEMKLIDGDDPVILQGINLEFFEGFHIDSNYIKSKIYLSGSEIADILTVRLRIDGVLSNGFGKTGASNLTHDYPGTALPAYGKDVDLNFKDEEIELKFEIVIEEGKIITDNMLGDQSVKVELAIWVPLIFDVTPGAIFALPGDLFSEEDDLFGRSSPDDDGSGDMLESLVLSIKMNTNPFTNAILVTESNIQGQANYIKFENPIIGKSLEINIDEKNMQEINNKYPFVPKLSIRFPNSAKLEFPRVFYAEELYFKARINYRMEL
jgi:hypothetical protein